MRLEQLTYFKKLAETGSITAASQQLYISQQALSTAIKKLENELHTQLFQRTSRGVVLTVQGEYLLEETSKILDKIDEIKFHLLTENKNEVHLKIGALPVVARHLLPKSISYFYKNFPNAHLNIAEMSSLSIIQQLQNSVIDLGFFSTLSINGTEDDFQTKIDMPFTPIMHLSFSVIVCKDHPLNKYNAVSFTQLTKYPAILMTFGENPEDYLPYRILQYYQVEPIIYADNEMLYNQMLKDGLGYALYTQISNASSHSLETSLVSHPLKDRIFTSIGYIQNTRSTEKLPYLDFFCKHI